MTPLSATADALAYQLAVISMYLDLPDTPVNVSLSDRQHARRWFESGVPLRTVETALLLGSLRRLLRPAQAPRLATIRSLAYFQPLVSGVVQDSPLCAVEDSSGMRIGAQPSGPWNRCEGIPRWTMAG